MNNIPPNIPVSSSLYNLAISDKTEIIDKDIYVTPEVSLIHDTLNTSELNKGKSQVLINIINTNKSEKSLDFVKNIDEIKKIVNEIISESYPELKKANFDFKTLNDDSFYFQSNFKPVSILKKHFDYTVMVNPDVFEKDCPKEAVKAILAHELSHTLDYESKGNIGVLKIGLKMLSPKKRDEYEHRTDLTAISRGYGNGLIEYRNWVYKNIRQESVIQKKKTYYQPEEIKAIQFAFDKAESMGRKDELLAKWLDNPPIGIERINNGSIL